MTPRISFAVPGVFYNFIHKFFFVFFLSLLTFICFLLFLLFFSFQERETKWRMKCVLAFFTLIKKLIKKLLIYGLILSLQVSSPYK